MIDKTNDAPQRGTSHGKYSEMKEIEFQKQVQNATISRNPSHSILAENSFDFKWNAQICTVKFVILSIGASGIVWYNELASDTHFTTHTK
jgi:hypothetical protein